MNELIRCYVLAGGKRIRPQLCLWTYEKSGARGQGSGVSPAVPLDLACAWELFHAFLLVHDDIIDNSFTRRGEASLHRQLASLDGNTTAFGANLGIVAGDLLFSAATRVWHELELPDDLYRAELKLYSRIATTTGFGQAIDICQSHAGLDEVDEHLLLKEYHWKTAAYTFEGPMLSGAIMARVSDGAMGAISRFALSLGQAYQIQNDLLDLSNPAHEGSDLVQGKRTIALVRARSAMADGRRADFDRRLDELKHANGQALGIAEGLRRDLWNSGAIETTQDLIADFLGAAYSASQDPALPPPLSSAMSQMLSSLKQQYFLTVEATSR